MRVHTYTTCWTASPTLSCDVSPGLVVASRLINASRARQSPLHATQTVVIVLSGSVSAAPSLNGTQAAVALAQAMAIMAPHVFLLTCGTQSLASDGAQTGAAQGGAWGVARVMRLEHASLRSQSMDVCCGTTVVHLGASEPEVVWSRGSCYAARLRSCSSVSVVTRSALVAPGLYAITGGLGGLGLRAAQLLIERGATRVLLASRSGRVVREGQGLALQLDALGASAEAVACDGADAPDSMMMLVRPVAGILHAAGTGDKGLLVGVSPCRLHLMFASKAFGARHLQVVMAAISAEVRILFSSVGSALGNVGQANYAAGNATLDAHALSLRRHGMTTCCLQWPLVGGAGMGAAAFAALGEHRVVGLAGISLEQYATCLAARSVSCHGLSLSIQMAHRSEVSELLDDLADAAQPRFGELAVVRTAAVVMASTISSSVAVRISVT